MRLTTLTLIAAICITGCKSIENSQVPSHKLKEIYVGQGPEDMVLDTAFTYPRLLVSCADRRSEEHYGEICEVNLNDYAFRTLPRVGTPDGIQFNPHGIDMQWHDGKPYLYVISHEKRDKKLKHDRHFLVKYLIEKDRLVYQDCYENKDTTISPNDLAVAPSGEIYFSNDASKHGSRIQPLLRLKRSSIGYYNPSTKKWKLFDEKGMAYANGVAIKGDTLYLSTVRSNRIYQYKIDDDGNLDVEKRTELCKIKGMDNLMFNGDNKLITTSHPCMFKFVGHAINSHKLSPSVVYEIELQKNDTKKVLFSDDGSRISTASTALIYKNKLYVAQVFEPFILEIEMGN